MIDALMYGTIPEHNTTVIELLDYMLSGELYNPGGGGGRGGGWREMKKGEGQA